MSLVRRHLLTLIGGLFSIMAIVWLAGRFDFDDLMASLREVKLALLIPVLPLMFLSFTLRTGRWLIILARKPPVGFWSGFKALMMGYMLNNVLPARAGDLYRVLALAKAESISRTRVLATLVAERTAELVFLLFLLSFVLLAYPALPDWLKQAGRVMAVLTAVAVSMLVFAHFMESRIIALLGSLDRRNLWGLPWVKVAEKTGYGLSGIAGIFRPARALGVAFLTALIWAVEVATVLVIASAVGVSLAPGNALFVLLVIAMGTMMPSSPGFIGTYEFFGVTALNIVGITGSSALALVVLLHAASILTTTMVGLVCFWLRPRQSMAEIAPRMTIP
jgi:uncharacterized protein (TIRG00374 family)